MFKAAQQRGRSFTRSDGLPIGGVLTFCNMLWKMLREGLNGVKPSHVAVVFDHSGKSFRNEIYSDYKGHRPEPPDELIPQFPLMRDAVRAFGLMPVEQEGFEADDLIATYARHALDRRGGRDDRGRRQGHDAAGAARRRHVRPDARPRAADRRRGGDREIRRAARQGSRGAGADRRCDRQRPGRARHRREDGRPADQRVRRPGDAARPHRRDQAGEAARLAHRIRRAGAAVQAARPARRERRRGDPARPALPRRRLVPRGRRPEAADRLPQGDGIHQPDHARRRADGHQCDCDSPGRAARAQGDRRPAPTRCSSPRRRSNVPRPATCSRRRVRRTRAKRMAGRARRSSPPTCWWRRGGPRRRARKSRTRAITRSRSSRRSTTGSPRRPATASWR